MMLKLAYQWRGVLIAVPVVVAAAWVWWECEDDLVLWLLGTALFLAGWAVRLWAQRYIGYRLKRPKALTIRGPYAWVRNPIYIGNTLIVVGFVVISEVLWMIPVTLVWCAAVYALVVRYEERRLTDKYGAAYLAYQAAVPRWLPRLHDRAHGGSPSVPLRHALRAEFHVVLLFALIVLQELIIDRWIE